MEEKDIESTIVNLLDQRSEDGKDLSLEQKFALNRVLDFIKKEKKYYVKKLGLPVNTGKKWSRQDEQRLLIDYDNGARIHILADKFKRTKGAIRARLIKNNRLEDDNYTSCD